MRIHSHCGLAVLYSKSLTVSKETADAVRQVYNYMVGLGLGISGTILFAVLYPLIVSDLPTPPSCCHKEHFLRIDGMVTHNCFIFLDLGRNRSILTMSYW